MPDAVDLGERLVEAGTLTALQVSEAKARARMRDESLSESLVGLGLADYAALGACLSDSCSLQYVPLLEGLEPPASRRFLSVVCARAWMMFPVAYDKDANCLTVAVHSPQDAERLRRVYRFFMEPQNLSFTIASQAEIKAAIKHHLVETPLQSVDGETARPKRKLSALARSATVARSVTRGRIGEGVATAGTVPRDTNSSQALASIAAVLARRHLEGDGDAVARVLARVRYCQLLASRQELSRTETEAVILAAWLSALDERRDLLGQLIMPFRVEEILFPPRRAGADTREATRVLSLVRCYQDLLADDPEAGTAVGLTRDHVLRTWPYADESGAMLETFLQVLMDEAFIAKIDRAGGRVLIVDPSEATSPVLSPPLVRNGLDVSVVPNLSAADAFLKDDSVDLLIVNAQLPDGSGTVVCRRIKGDPEKTELPVLMMGDARDPNLETECLRAGADDFVQRPVDQELLQLKIRRLLSARGDSEQGENEGEGVTGSLRDMSFTDLIQILAVGSKSMEILLNREGHEGRVMIREGEIIHAAADGIQGEDAFYALMQWKEGDFRTHPLPDSPCCTLATTSAMSLLMEGARLADEG